MLLLGLLIGIYSFSIFLLGILRLLYFPIILIFTLTFILFFYLYFKNKISEIYRSIIDLGRINLIILGLLMLFSFTNLIGALGPETAFDATWYHLTIPKIFIEKNQIFFIKGNLFYYSVMPQFTEMLYLANLVLSNEILAKLVHFSFGILTCIIVYKISREYLNKFYSLIAALIFYSNLVIDWLSVTAFADLSRAFYESLALYCLLKFFNNNKKYFLFSPIFLGFAIATKFLAILSLPIFVILIIISPKQIMKERLIYAMQFFLIAIFIASPWYLFAFVNTGNPFYPVFTQLMPNEFYGSISIFSRLLTFFINSPDPVSPIYIIIIPFLILIRNELKNIKMVFAYILLSILVLLVTPISGGGRFLVQFLPAYSVLVAFVIFKLRNYSLGKILMVVVFVIFLINISYRIIANSKYVAVILGFEDKESFLLNNLNFSFGDFYDENQEIKKLVGKEKVLLKNMHNLYYVDFNFTLDEWDDKNYKYILVQNGQNSKEYNNVNLIYENRRTNVFLYKL